MNADMPPDTLLSIGSLAEQAGVSTATLRYYDERGLMPPSTRADNGYRRYRRADVERLRFIGRAKQFGCTLDEIEVLLRAWDGGVCGPVQSTLQEMVDRKIDQSHARLVEVTTFLAQLQRSAAALRRHRPDGPCDDRCGCIPDAPVPGSTRTEGLSITPSPRSLHSRHSLPEPRTGSGPDTPGVRLASDDALVCSLEPDRMADRMAEFQRLLQSVDSREPLERGLRLRFPHGTIDIGATAALLAAEHECCPFWEFAITIGSGGVSIDICGPETAKPLIDALFGVAR